MELDCATWRHNQEDVVFSLKLRPNELTETSGSIELSVEASNLSDLSLIRLPVRISVTDGSTIEEARGLIDLLGEEARAYGRL